MDNNLNNDLDNKNLESNTENKKDEVSLEKVEELRFNVFCFFVTFVLIAIFLFLFALIYFVFTFNLRIFIILGLLFLPAIIIVGLAPNEIRIFNAAYKKYFISLVLKENFRDAFFDINKGIDKSVIEETQVIKLGDTYCSSDYISGFYKNIKFEYSDVNTFDYNTNYTFFYGRWFIIDFNKKFKSNIQICENTFVNRKQKGRLFNKRSDFEKIHLEDIDFNKKFSVFAQNEMTI